MLHKRMNNVIFFIHPENANHVNGFTNFRLPFTVYRLQFTDCRLPFTDYCIYITMGSCIFDSNFNIRRK